MRSLLVWATLAAGAVASPAHAAWHVAQSKHFIIYADQNPKNLTDFATRLEKFDQATRAIIGLEDPEVGDGNRVTVFVMPTVADVQKLAGDTFLSGFYTGRATGSLAYISSSKGREGALGTDTILFHEYAHHLMMQQLDMPYPEWYVEGFAEFLSTPVFDKDGSVGLGAVPMHRGWGLFNGRPLALEALLGASYGDVKKLPKEQRESIYGRGWLLTHYLSLEPTRAGQLDRYIVMIANGTAPLEAARSTFGDLKQLDKELDAYLNRRKLSYLKVGAGRIRLAPIDVRPLTPGGSEVILLRARMKKEVPTAEREATAAQLRAIETRFVGDELVEATLAEAELIAGHAEAAEAAAGRALKANPRNTEAMILKGKAMALRAETMKEPEARHRLFNEARATFIAANKIDSEDPEPLMEFYKAFLSEGVRPTANAIAALHYASDLAPQDLGVRMNSAIAYLNDGKFKEARTTLIPIAYSPHASTAADIARRMIARIDAGDGRAALRDAFAGEKSETSSR